MITVQFRFIGITLTECAFTNVPRPGDEVQFFTEIVDEEHCGIGSSAYVRACPAETKPKEHRYYAEICPRHDLMTKRAISRLVRYAANYVETIDKLSEEQREAKQS